MKQARKVENKGEIQNKQNFFLRNMILIQEHQGKSGLHQIQDAGLLE